MARSSIALASSAVANGSAPKDAPLDSSANAANADANDLLLMMDDQLLEEFELMGSIAWRVYRQRIFRRNRDQLRPAKRVISMSQGAGLAQTALPGRKFLQPARQLIEFPLPRQCRRLGPGRRQVVDARHGRLAVHGGDRTIETQLLGLFDKAAGLEDRRQAAVFLQQRRRAAGADARRARQFVRRIAAQRDEVRHLGGLDAVTRTDLGRADPLHAAAADRIEDRRFFGGQLEGVAVAAGDEHSA